VLTVITGWLMLFAVLWLMLRATCHPRRLSEVELAAAVVLFAGFVAIGLAWVLGIWR